MGGGERELNVPLLETELVSGIELLGGLGDARILLFPGRLFRGECLSLNCPTRTLLEREERLEVL
jgi:hypothetical protein